MNRDQAIDLASILKGLMPRMTDEQAKAAGRELLRVDVAPASEAVQRYARTASDFVLADFVRCLPARAQPGETPADRTRRQLVAEKARQTELEAYWADADAYIGALSAEELEVQRLAAIEELRKRYPTTADYVAGRDVRTCRPLKGAIFDLMRTTGGVLA